MATKIKPLQSESLLKSRLFSIERQRYARADGQQFTRDAIIHPGAVVILPVLHDGSIVMIRNIRHVVGQELIELPAGTLEPDEDPRDCATRELREETGYQAETLKAFGCFFTSPGILTETMYAFIAFGLRQVGQDLDDGEEIKVEVVKVDEARRMVMEGQIVDAKSLAVLGRHFLNMER